jgi:hypothetical protein
METVLEKEIPYLIHNSTRKIFSVPILLDLYSVPFTTLPATVLHH